MTFLSVMLLLSKPKKGVLRAAVPKTFPLSGLRLIQDQLGIKRLQRAAVRTLMQCIITNVMQAHNSSQSTHQQLKESWLISVDMNYFMISNYEALCYFSLP